MKTQTVQQSAKLPKRASVSYVITNFIARGLDGVGAWVGASINNNFLSRLAGERERLARETLTPVRGMALVLLGQGKIQAYPITARKGDIYERVHYERFLNRRIKVRGSLALLQSSYGEDNAVMMPVSEALKLLESPRGVRVARHNLEAALS